MGGRGSRPLSEAQLAQAQVEQKAQQSDEAASETHEQVDIFLLGGMSAIVSHAKHLTAVVWRSGEASPLQQS
jgi:hypothetical protein